jgi:hypothetical protein
MLWSTSTFYSSMQPERPVCFHRLSSNKDDCCCWSCSISNVAHQLYEIIRNIEKQDLASEYMYG